MKTFKTTRKEFELKYEMKMDKTRAKNAAEDAEDFDTWRVLKAELATEEDYFTKLDKVTVAYSIGHRSYANEVVKIGKSYFLYGRSMTAGRGYWGVTEIPEITDEMKADMLSDSYYY
jgi:hypothetical protein